SAYQFSYADTSAHSSRMFIEFGPAVGRDQGTGTQRFPKVQSAARFGHIDSAPKPPYSTCCGPTRRRGLRARPSANRRRFLCRAAWPAIGAGQTAPPGSFRPVPAIACWLRTLPLFRWHVPLKKRHGPHELGADFLDNLLGWYFIPRFEQLAISPRLR